jgi:hypothetical protein
MAEAKSTFDYTPYIAPNGLATIISQLYDKWKQGRNTKEKEWAEVRDYIFAIDTTKTTNKQLPWKNKTTRPKLCQIRDNLHANYMAALFPSDNWFKWQATDQEGIESGQGTAIQSYIIHKMKDSGFKETVSRLVYDFIDYGNCMADVEYSNEVVKVDQGNGTFNSVPVYVGPKLVRISPLDIVFDLTGHSFENVPKITRTLLSLGQIEKLRRTNPDWSDVAEDTMLAIRANRKNLVTNQQSLGIADIQKLQGFVADGFSSLVEYYKSGLVEFLEFEGDLYDAKSDTLYENHVITVVDRLYVVRNETIRNWFGKSYKQHCGWRLRPDNLMAMGPLDNLVGLQYRLDHLENLFADAFDLFAFPPLKVKGYVEDFKWGPNERIYMEQDADVESLGPDSSFLQARMEIAQLEQTMEDMAGAPKQAMGIRTPGEKTAFEVGQLENAASRIFQNKTTYFEENFLEKLMNSFLEIARRNMVDKEIVSVIKNEDGIQEFMAIGPDEIKSKGKLVPMGARHFAAQSQLVQNLTALSQTGMYQDPAVQVHFSGIKLAQLMEQNLNLEKTGVVRPFIRIDEELQKQQLAQQAQEELGVHSMTPAQTQGDMQGPPAAPTQPTQQQPIPGSPPHG